MGALQSLVHKTWVVPLLGLPCLLVAGCDPTTARGSIRNDCGVDLNVHYEEATSAVQVSSLESSADDRHPDVELAAGATHSIALMSGVGVAVVVADGDGWNWSAFLSDQELPMDLVLSSSAQSCPPGT